MNLRGPEQGLWLAHQVAADKSLYNVAQLTRIDGPFCPERFIQAVSCAFSACNTFHFAYRRHQNDSLAPAKRIALPPEVLAQAQTEYLQASGRSETELKAQVFTPDLRSPTDLSQDLPFRSILVKHDEKKYLWYLRSHHIAIDGMGLAIWMNKVWKVYAALETKNQKFQLPGAPIIAAHLAWSSYADSPRKDSDARFWRHYLCTRSEPQYVSGPQALIDHPVSRPVQLSKALADLHKRECLKRKVPQSTMWLAAFAQSILRESQAPEVTLGIPFANRFGSAAASIPCMWMNLLPLRVLNQPNISLWDQTQQIQTSLQLFSRHRLYRHEWIRQDMRRWQKHPELFGPVFNAISLPRPPEIPGLHIETFRLSGGPVQDLSLTWINHSGNKPATLELELPAARANKTPFDNWSQSLLNQALCQKQRKHPTKQPPDILEMIAATVKQHSSKPALDAKTGNWSYQELWDAAKRLAPRIEEIEGPVLLWLARGPNAIIAMIACLMARRAYAPLDTEGPIERNLSMIEALDPGLILREKALPTELAATNIPSHDLRGPVKPATNRASQAFPGRSIAYWMHTSGSTGTPRAVAISRQALSSFVRHASKRYGWGSKDRVLHFAPLAFDASVEEIFLCLVSGSTLVVRTSKDITSIDTFIRTIRIRRISVLDLPTAFWHEWVYAGEQDQDLGIPAYLRQVIIGGEPVLKERVKQWRALAPQEVELLNSYGPTESTVVVSVADLHKAHHPPDSIGEAIAPETLLVLDEQDNPCPQGQSGEITVISASVSSGYANAPTHNHERFFVSQDKGLRGYRTGDLGRFDEHGELVFLGRRDQEIKISGFRIHPSEVEAALLAEPCIEHAVVLVERQKQGPACLRAHVQASPSLDQKALRLRLEARLIPAARPRSIEVHRQLPKTSAGKIDRKALESLDPSRNQQSAPLKGLAGDIAKIWQELLQVPVTHKSCDFFELGGESLHCLALATRLSRALNTPIDANLFISYPKLEDLCQAIESGAHQRSDQALELLRDHMLEDLASIEVDQTKMGPPGPARNILLTGSTGFIGGQFLGALASNPELKIICLVRNLPAKPKRYPATVQWLQGDVSRPQLGLTAVAFEALGQAVDAVVHCAGTVNLMHDYSHCRKTNVQGTKTLLDLLNIGPAKRLVALSTLAVAPGAEHLPQIPEGPINWHPGLHNGYTQSKWVSEQALIQAHAKGHWCSALRIGRAYGHRPNDKDLLSQVLCASAEHGVWPSLDVRESWVSNQELVAVVHDFLSSKTRWPGVLNVSDGLNYSWIELFKLAAPDKVKLTPVQSWLDTLTQSEQKQSKALAGLLTPLVHAAKQGQYLGLPPAQNLFLDHQISTLDANERYTQMLHKGTSPCHSISNVHFPSKLRRAKK